MTTTMQGLGIVLSGQIHSQLRAKEGIAGDILSNPSSQSIDPFVLHDVNVLQIGDHIVKLGSKGIWILLIPESTASQYDQPAFSFCTLSFKDDVAAIEHVSCNVKGQMDGR